MTARDGPKDPHDCSRGLFIKLHSKLFKNGLKFNLVKPKIIFSPGEA